MHMFCSHWEELSGTKVQGVSNFSNQIPSCQRSVSQHGTAVITRKDRIEMPLGHRETLSLLLCNRNEPQCPLQYIKQKAFKKRAWCSFWNSWKLFDNISQAVSQHKTAAKQNSDKQTPALKLKWLALRGNCESATTSDDKNRCLENRSNCATTNNKRSSA